MGKNKQKDPKKKEKGSILGKLSSASNLPLDVLGGMPMFEMAGNREIFIEGVSVLKRYDEDCVSLSLGKLDITICGRNLTLKNLADENILISGYLTSITFE